MKYYFQCILVYLIEICLLNTSVVNCINSYIYLNDKLINEEIPIGSFVINLKNELDVYNKSIKNQLNHEMFSNQQFTLLEDSKISNGNSYFEIDQTEAGQLITKRLIDREFMCMNRQCAEPCEQISFQFDQQPKFSSYGSCRINLKVLMLPSYNILNLNILIQDINDNQPMFRTNSILQKISENVPIGYKIPIDLAYDPDIGRNKIQFYEISEPNSNIVKKTFKLSQNHGTDLHLVVVGDLDRENISSYNFKITAYDGGSPPLSSSVNVTIEITDMNDNNPIFEKSYYKFSIKENAPIDSLIGSIKANDLDDSNLNGLVKYRFIDNSNLAAVSGSNNNRFLMQKGSVMQNFLKNFDLDENTGIIKLKSSLDHENEKKFVLTVEAKDAGIGSLPSFATIEISVIDINDNAPEISASFLNTLHRNKSLINGYKYDVYLPEDTKSNKFLAHININDKDSNENGMLDWAILVNNNLFSNSSISINDYSNYLLKIIKLNNNSFTLNIGNSSLLDREQVNRHNISIKAWDHGMPFHETFFNFSLVLVDVNDNAPEFEKTKYELSIFENNEPFQLIFKVKANDADSNGSNSNITYSFKENIMNDYLIINENGVIFSKLSFDREKIEKFIFNIVASDQGQPSLSTSVNFVLNILDLNDNKPSIIFNTSFYHRFYKLNEDHNEFNKKNSKSRKFISGLNNQIKIADKIDDYLYIRIGENLQINSRIIDFRATDKDINENAKVEFFLNHTANNLPFRLDKDGQFTLVKSLNKTTKNLYDLLVICRDFGTNPGRLHSILQLTIEIVDSNEYCIKLKEENQISKTKFFNRDSEKDLNNNDLFTIDYWLNEDDNDDEKKGLLSFELMTHKDLLEIRPLVVNREITTENIKTNQFFYRLEIKFKETLSKNNLSKIMLGKYIIKIKLIDNYNPTCNNIEQFTLIIGSNFISEKEMFNYLNTHSTTKIQLINKNNLRNEFFFNDDIFENTMEPKNDDDSSNYDSSNDINTNNQYLFQSKSTKYRIKPATFMDSDYILLFILIVIVLVTAILLAFIGIICFCSKLKSKQYKHTVKKTNSTLNKKFLSELDELADLTDTNLEILRNSSRNSYSKIFGKNKNFKNSELNTTTMSNNTQYEKNNYKLVHDKNGSSKTCNNSIASNGTLIFRDPDDEDFGIITSSGCPIRQFSNRNKSQTLFNQLKYQQPHSRYIYSSTLANKDLNTISYDESNSNPESLVDTTTIDDSKSSSLNNDYEISITKPNKNSLNRLNAYKNQTKIESSSTTTTSSNSSSSAYSSISNSENVNSFDIEPKKVTF